MLKLLRMAGGSGALLAATLVVVMAMAVGAAGVASAVPARHHGLRAWLKAHGVLVHRSHAGRRVARTAIVGGNQISIEQAPWQVVVLGAIRVEEHGEVFFVLLICGGSIIDSTHVVTAAHCVYNPETGAPLPAEHVAVVAGVSNLAVEHEPHEQFREAASFRVHPNYSYSSGSSPDDVAVVTLSGELALSSAPGSAVSSIGLVAAGATPAEGLQVNLTGFGRENASTSLHGELNSLSMTIGSSRQCGGEADAVFLCANTSTGSACFGDSGSGLTTIAATPTLIAVMNTVAKVSGEYCRAGSTNGFVNLEAPEIRDFIEGNSSPPLAPRGGNAIEVSGVPKVGNTLTCRPGSWSGAPTIAYLFIDSGQVLQAGASSTYVLSAGDVGRTILCEVQATNAGGTGTVRTTSLRAIEAAPAPPSPPPSSPPSPPASPSVPSSLPGNGSTQTGSGGAGAAIVHHEGVLLAGTRLTVQSGGVALAKLDCKEAENCNGTVTLLAKRTVKAKGGKRAPHTTTTTTVKIGTATFSLEAGTTETVKIHLNATGRALLSAGHGHLAASLTIEEAEVHTGTDSVHLVAQQKGHGSRKGRR